MDTAIEQNLFIAPAYCCRGVLFGYELETSSVGTLGTFVLRIIKSLIEPAGRCRGMERC